MPEGLTALRSRGEEFPIEETVSRVNIGGEELCTLILRDINEKERALAELERIQLETGYLKEELESEYGLQEIVGSSEGIMNTLREYAWPGNIRELENIITRALIVSRGPELTLGDWLPRRIAHGVEDAVVNLEDLERDHIRRVLERTGRQVSGEKGAARLLGLKPTTLESRLKKLGIKRPGR